MKKEKIAHVSPIIKKEIEVRGRHISFPLLIIAINTVMLIISLMGSFGIVIMMRTTARAMYGELLSIYELISISFYVIILLTAPLFTASSISGERQSGTLDLLLTTRLTPANIVAEKTISAFVSVLVIIISGLPALIIPLMFGGINLTGVILTLLSFVPGAFFALCSGMLASSFTTTIPRSIAITYGMIFSAIFLTALLPILTRAFSSGGENIMAYLMLLNPILPVASAVTQLTGGNGLVTVVFMLLGATSDGMALTAAAPICMLLQTALSIAMLIFAIINITPSRGKKREF